MKSHKTILSLLLLLGSISSVMAEVSISNIYYSDYATIVNDMFLDGVDYSDAIDISSAGVSGSGTASSSELKSGNSTYVDSIQIPYMKIGSENKIVSDNFKYQKKMMSDFCSVPSLSSDFKMTNGSSLSRVWNEFSSAQFNLEIVGFEYDGSQLAQGHRILMDGYGARDNSYEGNSNILQNLSLSHMGQSAETDMAFQELNVPPGPIPSELYWTNHIESWYSDWAISDVFFKVAYDVPYKADFYFAGKSDVPVYYAQLINNPADTTGYDEWWIKYFILPEEVTLGSNDTSE